MNEENMRKNIHRFPWLWGILISSAVFTVCFIAGVWAFAADFPVHRPPA